MKELEGLWKETSKKCNNLEKSLVDCYIDFLRKTAKVYLKQGRRVFFKENKVVHWGEGNFGSLIIEGKEDVDEVFGEYVSEIRFESELDAKVIGGYREIKEGNITDIKYKVF